MKKLILFIFLLFPLITEAGSDILSTPISQMCVTGYSATVRDVPLSLKKEIHFAAGVVPYGSLKMCSKGWEVDHRISLSLNGSNDRSNLQLQARCTYAELTAEDGKPIGKRTNVKPMWKGQYDAYKKDTLELRLLKDVCVNKTTQLSTAQQILRDWKN